MRIAKEDKPTTNRPIIFFEKFGQNKKSAYLCSPFAKKAGSEKKREQIYVTCH